MASLQVEILNKSLKKKRQENPRLSIRWLAKSLELSAPMMTRVLNGQRLLPAKLVPKVGKLLDIDRDDQERILKELLKSKGYAQDSMRALVSETFQTKNKEPISWERPAEPAFDLFKAWYFIAILDTTSLKTYDGTIEFIARKLKLDVKLVENAFEELKSVGMLEMADGRWQKAVKFLELSSSSHNLDSIRRLHMDHLDKIKKQLETKISEDDRNKRFVTGVTLTASKDKIAIARMKAAEFMQELVKDLSSGDADEVYHVALQLYPLT